VRLLIFSFLAFFSSLSAFAEYKFFQDNPYQVQLRLYKDILAGHVDQSNLGPYVKEAIAGHSPNAVTPATLNKLGEISDICLLFGKKSQTTRFLSIRTMHKNGCGDWVISAQTSPELLTSLVLIPLSHSPGRTDACGPPAIVPLPASGEETYILPAGKSCRSIDKVAEPLGVKDYESGCALFKGMCRNAD
jgi:hypothetical protein